jgi:hypothetical protein
MNINLITKFAQNGKTAEEIENEIRLNQANLIDWAIKKADKECKFEIVATLQDLRALYPQKVRGGKKAEVVDMSKLTKIILSSEGVKPNVFVIVSAKAQKLAKTFSGKEYFMDLKNVEINKFLTAIQKNIKVGVTLEDGSDYSSSAIEIEDKTEKKESEQKTEQKTQTATHPKIFGGKKLK